MKKKILSVLMVAAMTASMVAVLNKPEAVTMPMLIANLAAGYTVDYGMLMMGVLFCSIPTMIIFFVLQKQFAEGITGAVK